MKTIVILLTFWSHYFVLFASGLLLNSFALKSQIVNKPDSVRFTPILNNVRVSEQVVSYRVAGSNIRDAVRADTITRDTIALETVKEPVRRIRLNVNDLFQLYPQAVFTAPNGRRDVDYFTLVPIMFRIMQEQQAKIEELENKLEKLD